MKHLVTATTLSLIAIVAAEPSSAACARTQLNVGAERALRDLQIRGVDVCRLSRTQKAGLKLVANGGGSFSDMRRRGKSIVNRR